MKRILLTGAAGFLGSACAPLLRAAGHMLVTSDRHGSVELVGNLADPRFTSKLPDVDVVVHAAAVQYVSRDLPMLRRDAYFHENNIQATANLCQRYAKSDVHFVNIGTSMMYRQCAAASYSTDSALEGQGVYSTSKLAAQRRIESSMSRWSTIVPCIIGGVGREGLFRGFVKSIRQHGAAIIPGSGDMPVHTVHVSDVAALVELVVRRQAPGLYNAGAPDPLSIRQWVEVIAAQLQVSPVRILSVPLMPVWGLAALSGYRLLAREQLMMLAQPHVLDISKSLELGWQPQNDCRKIVSDIARYIAST